MLNIKSVDITGALFGRLTALKIEEVRNGHEYWLCACECGGFKVVRKSHLVGGRIRSCGCLYSGQKRGRSGQNTYVFVDDYVVGADFKGNRFYFDRDDFDLLAPFIWYCNHDGYVVARIDGTNITMHRFLLGDTPIAVDHENGQKYDNRRFNLRSATNAENVANRKESYVGKSIIGVYQRKRYDKFEAAITKEGVRHSLGFFDNYEDAVRARLSGEITYFGEFAPQKHLFTKYGIKEKTNA